VIVTGGEVGLPLIGTVDILGLRRARVIIDAAIANLPPDSPERATLRQVSEFAQLAAENLDVSKPILATIGSPVRVRQRNVEGAETPIESFVIAVALTASLMLITVLLAAGMLALEREEHAFARLVRGLVSRTGLLMEKIGLAALCSFVVCLLMLVGLAAFLDLDFGRVPGWVAALLAAALGFAALGVAIGGLTREVRAASLLAFLLSLPIAFLALVPAGAVSAGLFDAINVVSGLFPFKPSLRALEAAINGEALGRPLLHLAALTAGFALLARVSLRRFA
jgi:ABC-type multidrug transport system permease subunit